MLIQVRWPKTVYLVVMDPRARTLTRYRCREMLGSWEWAGEDPGPEMVERLRARGPEEEVRPKEVA